MSGEMGQAIEKLGRRTVMSRMDMEKEEARILDRWGYEVVRPLGEGAFSRVLLVRKRSDRLPQHPAERILQSFFSCAKP